MFAFKVTTVGSSLGFIVPKAAQDYLKVKKGDTVTAVVKATEVIIRRTLNAR